MHDESARPLALAEWTSVTWLYVQGDNVEWIRWIRVYVYYVSGSDALSCPRTQMHPILWEQSMLTTFTEFQTRTDNRLTETGGDNKK